jgi:hypothetical protein
MCYEYFRKFWGEEDADVLYMKNILTLHHHLIGPSPSSTGEYNTLGCYIACVYTNNNCPNPVTVVTASLDYIEDDSSSNNNSKNQERCETCSLAYDCVSYDSLCQTTAVAAAVRRRHECICQTCSVLLKDAQHVVKESQKLLYN